MLCVLLVMIMGCHDLIGLVLSNSADFWISQGGKEVILVKEENELIRFELDRS